MSSKKKDYMSGIIMLLSVVLVTCVTIVGYILCTSLHSSKVVSDAGDQYVEEISNISDENGKLKNGDLSVDWEGLQEKNSDIVAWLRIPGTNINTPVVQHSDNSYYLKHDLNRNYTSNGNVFMDYRNDTELYDSNTVIYGHNLRDGTAFGKLIKYYSTTENAQKHPVIELYTPKGKNEYVLVGSFYTNALSKSNNGYVFPYTVTNLDTHIMADFNHQLEKRFLYSTGVELIPEDKILTLSTCAYQFKEERFVVVAKKLKGSENSADITYRFKTNPNPLYPQAYYDAKHIGNPYRNTEKWNP